MADKIKVEFVCIHNSCRSQMAEAICKMLAGEVLEAYSAGTEIKSQINPDAVRVIEQEYGVNITKSQRPKLLEEIPPVDVVVSMGCEVNCPYLPCRHREDWGLSDPTGKGASAFLETAKIIESKVLDLKKRIENHEIL
jgi:arsenate reductase (thioredoxin)